jgi:oligopeptide transport system substrate-binding protein
MTIKPIQIFLVFGIAGVLFSCGPGSGGSKEAKGGRVYGGTLNLSETEKFQTLYPSSVTDVISSNICYQIYEGLLKFNAKNPTEIIAGIAESWERDASGTIYTFKLREGVFFHDDPCFPGGKGREVTAEDFKYSFEQLCTQGPNNHQFAATFKGRVLGADAYFAGSENGNAGLEGVKVLDSRTLQITLTSPSNSFLYILAMPGTFVVPKEAIEKYGMDAHIGTGPFKPVKPDPNAERLILVKNPKYYGKDTLGNQLPFLDSVIISFYPTKAKELDAFQQGKLDVIFGLPPEAVSEVVQNSIKEFQSKPPKYELIRSPELETQYYEINTSKAPFNNVKVRQAFNYAINRTKIIDEVLKGEAFGPGVYGLVPPAFKGYDTTQVRGYSFNREKARKLLAEAGYPGGKGFPTVKIELNSGGTKHSKVVEEIKNQLKDVLGVNIEYEIVPMKQKLEDAKFGRADLFRTAWVADFPSPESFLWVLTGFDVPAEPGKPSFPNVPRYKNALYDSLFLQGAKSPDLKTGYEYFMKAEQQMLNDAPVIVLWYVEIFKLNYTYVKNFPFNSLRQLRLEEVYLDKKKKDAGENPMAGEGK